MFSDFVHLDVHSNFSMGWGASSIEKLCRTAAERGFKRLALTDTNGFYGLLWFIQACKRYSILPIVGAYLDTGEEHCVMLAKNRFGYSTICDICSRIHCKSDFSLSSYLKVIRPQIIILSDQISFLEKIKNTGNSVFARVIITSAYSTLYNWAKNKEIDTVITNNVHFASESDFERFKLLRAIHDNTTLDQTRTGNVSRHNWLKSAKDMKKHCYQMIKSFNNSECIADQCSNHIFSKHFVFPQIQGEKGKDADTLLHQKIMDGVKWRYGRMTPAVKERIKYEFDIILKKQFSSYFLVVADIVKQAPRTCGRGSAASSLVSYALGITHVDPVRYNLFFERFLNQGRTEPPDIDVDFPWDERDRILIYIFKKYGPEHAAMIANHITFKARSCIREVAKVYGLSDQEIGRITKRISGLWEPDNLMHIIQSHPAFRSIHLTEPWPEIIHLAESIRGFPRYLSVHCGGVVIAPDGLKNHVPIQPAARVLLLNRSDAVTLKTISSSLTESQTLFTIQWEKEQAEDFGFVKIDILGNRSLAVIRDCLDAIYKNYNKKIDYQSWSPLHDAATQKLLSKGDTIGVFYVESPAMRQLQIKTGKGDFEHLVIHSSIIRPAANEYINEYIRRLKGGRFEYLHPKLDILKETFGIMVYQEDVSKVAMEIADFTPTEADELRKILSKKHKQKKVQDYKEKFIRQAAKNNVSAEICEKIWQMIQSFSGYSFCKPHSASYALVSFKSAYLRSHYPAEFMASVISNQGGYYSTFAYISESRRMGLEVLMPDINKSVLHYYGIQKSIRVGFMQIKDLGAKSIQKILKERIDNGLYQSFNDFLERVTLTENEISLLIKAGCFDELEPLYSRPQLLWLLKLYQKRKGDNLLCSDSISVPDICEFSQKTRFDHEIDLFGMIISTHPLTLYKDKIEKIRYIPACDFKKYKGKKITAIGWYITGKVTGTRHEQLMEFSSFEDLTGIYESTFFPEAFDKFKFMLDRNRAFLLKGIIDCHYNAISLNIEKITCL